MPHILPAYPLRIKRTMQSTRTVTARELARVFHESQAQMIARVLRVLGEERVIAILADALTCEHEGGMWLKDGSRKRSLGGIFLQLCREQATREERRKIFG
jgi:phosphorylated adapter RNA export protein